jgi:tetratricopeptide (TPR) repeat protein
MNEKEIIDQAIETASQMITDKPRVAELILKQLLKCDPEHKIAMQLLGLCKYRLEETEEAIEIIQTAIEIDPNSAENWNNLGLAYSALENFERSIECFEKAIELAPTQFLFNNNLALQYRHIGDYDKAVMYLKKALEIEEVPRVLSNLGGVYGEMKELQKARECFERALEISPTYIAAHIDLSYNYFLEGNWEAGFKEYEWRFDFYPQMKGYLKNYDQNKRWDGVADLNGKRVLVYCEQGLGDSIHFVRYLKHLKERGAIIYLHCINSLNRLFERLEEVTKVINFNINSDDNSTLPEYDYQVPIISLPNLLNNYEISGKPYIKASTDKFKELMEKYSDTFNIGIVWAGSPAHPHDKRRSIPLKYFRPIKDIEGVKLFSLQIDQNRRCYGHYVNTPEDITAFKSKKEIIDYIEDCEDFKLVDLTNIIQDFEDTATVLMGLDLLIVCDTATAHLAGAMGVPCWIVNAYNSDWRWQVDGDTTPWYDSVLLFRQPKRDDWAGAFELVKGKLNEVLLQNK